MSLIMARLAFSASGTASVPKRGETGSGNNSAKLARDSMILGAGTGQSSGGSGRAVTGRAWTIANLPLASVHSMSIGRA